MRIFALNILILLFINIPMKGQEIISLRSVSGYEGDEIQEVVPEPTSTRRDGVTRLTEVTQPRIHVYNPEPSKSNGDAMIVCPGGGYQILAIDKEGTEIAEWLVGLGYTVYVLEYRVPNLRDEAFSDLVEAIYMARNQNSFKEDSKLGVIGFSAGGHLTATVSTKPDESNEMNGGSEKPDFVALIYPAYLDKGENERLSPEVPLTEKTIPMFIFATADDPYAHSAVVLAEALQKNKTSVEFHMLPEGGHGYGLREGEAAKTWPILLEKWLVKQN